MSRSARDYQGGAPGHFWPKLAGWFVVPAISGIAARLAAPLVVKPTDTPEKQMETLMTLNGVAHALGAAGSWYASGHMFNDSVGTQAFFRGGMWSEMVSAILIPAAGMAASSLNQANIASGAAAGPPAVTKGIDPRTHINSLVSMLTAGASDKIAQPHLYRALKARR